jgi:hypothetical protein
MTNPAQLLLAGNPRPTSKRRQKRRGSTVTTIPTKEVPMARRRKKAKSRTARVAKRRARRSARKAHRKGKMPAGLAAYWAGKRGGKAKRSRPSRKARMHVKRAKVRRRRARASSVVAVAVAPNPRRRRKSHKARAHKRSRRRSRVGVNPGALSLSSGLTGIMSNVKATFMHGGLKGFAAAAAGAGGAVFAGTIVSRTTTPLLMKLAPSLAMNPIIARLLGAANYYLAGWALAKWTPGISPRTRRGMLTGAALAAIVEAAKPGAVRQAAASLPIVGGVFGGTLSGLADGMGDYVSFALSDLGGDDGDSSVGEYVALGDTSENQGGAMYATPTGAYDDNAGMGDYVAFSR